MLRTASILTVASALLLAACESSKKTSSEEAPIKRGSTPAQQRPKQPPAPPPVTPAPPTPGASVPAPVTPPTPAAPLPMDTVRPPVAADLPIYLQKVKGTGTLTATLETTEGTIHCTLLEKEAPMTVANFVGLATGQKPYVDGSGQTQKGKPFFDGICFHRVIPQFMVQGGDPLCRGTGGPGYSFADEIVGLHHDVPGILSMANSGPATNGSQFFITEAPTTWLDTKHTIFGRCKEIDVIKKMTALSGPGDKPTKPITITKATISRV